MTKPTPAEPAEPAEEPQEPTQPIQPDDMPAEDVQLYEDMQRQIAELSDAIKRERADATNLRRRHDEHVANLKTVVKATIVRDLLPVIDNFERAIKHVPEELKGNDYIKGVESILKQFEKTLSDLGVTRIKTTGEPFDPRFHEAVSMEDSEGDTEVVSEELQSGYAIGDEVIRYAMVRVKMQ